MRLHKLREYADKGRVLRYEMPPKRRLSTSGGGEDEDEQPAGATAVPEAAGKKKRKLDPAQQIQVQFLPFRKFALELALHIIV
jgi:hypothetical protein